VRGVDQRRYALIGQEVGRGILLCALALVEDDLHLDPALVGIEQGLGDRCRGEAIGLGENGVLRAA
jgi:hypothetical protein